MSAFQHSYPNPNEDLNVEISELGTCLFSCAVFSAELALSRSRFREPETLPSSIVSCDSRTFPGDCRCAGPRTGDPASYGSTVGAVGRDRPAIASSISRKRGDDGDDRSG